MDNTHNGTAPHTTLVDLFKLIGIPLCIAFSLLNFFMVVMAYRAARNIIVRQTCLNHSIDYLSFTVSKQIFPLKVLDGFLKNTNYDMEKLDKDRWDFLKWYCDPRGASFREPENVFESVPPDDKNYATFKTNEMDPNKFWKEESGSPKSPSGKVNLAATVPSNSPTKPPTPIKPTSSPVKSNPGVVRREMKKSAAKSKGSGSVKTTITQTEDDDSTYENLQNLSKPANTKSRAVDGVEVPRDESGRHEPKAQQIKSKPTQSDLRKSKASKGSVKTSLTQSEGLYENVDKPINANTKTMSTKSKAVMGVAVPPEDSRSYSN